jgi:ribosomal-protein-alanine N-acetyltransferase
MVDVDHAAFSPLWQLSYSDLFHAQRIATRCTLAVKHDRIIGYQLSTMYRQTGHLARLAVLPEHQGTGVGAALLDNLIRYFIGRSVRTLTVNTQGTNTRSQRLYTRSGFRRNGYDLAVWTSEP